MKGWLGEDKNWFLNEANKKEPREKETKVPDVIPSVYYVAVRCPICKSKKCPAYSSDPPIRYHRCEKGHNFKSIEK